MNNMLKSIYTRLVNNNQGVLLADYIWATEQYNGQYESLDGKRYSFIFYLSPNRPTGYVIPFKLFLKDELSCIKNKKKNEIF